MESVISIEYQTVKEYCECCEQKLKKPVTSDARKFHFSKKDCLDWLARENWKTEAEYDDELEQIIQEFVYETIGFYAASSDVRIIISDEEFDRMKTFILQEIVA